jgi:hypothetical protein
VDVIGMSATVRLPAIVVIDLPGHRAKCRRCGVSLCAEGRAIAESRATVMRDAALAAAPWRVR